MRVVVVADFSYPNFLGGSARYVYDLVKNYYEMKIANREICFDDMVKEISRTPLISNTT